jgi:hypothetical protein
MADTTAPDPMPFLTLEQGQEHEITIDGLGSLTIPQRNSLSYNEELATFAAFETVDQLTQDGKSVREVNIALYLPIVLMLLRRHDPALSEAQVKESVPTAFWEPCFEFFLAERNGGKPPENREGKPSAEAKPSPSSSKPTGKSTGD